MSISVSDNFKLTNPKPLFEWERYNNGDGTYRHWASNTEVESFFAATGMAVEWMKNKYFWIAGYYMFYDGSSFISIGSADNFIGKILPTSAAYPNTDNKPIWGLVSNTSGSSQTYTNYGGIVLADGESGKLAYDGSSWSYLRDQYNVDAIMESIGLSIVSNEEFLYAISDSDGKVLFGLKSDGSTYIPSGVPDEVATALASLDTSIAGINDTLNSVKGKTDYFSFVSNVEFVWAIQDVDGNVIFGVRSDGSTYIPDGMPEDVATKLNEFAASINSINAAIVAINSVMTTLQSKANYVSIGSDQEFLYAIADVDGNVLFGIRKDGSILNNNTFLIDGLLDNIDSINSQISGLQ